MKYYKRVNRYSLFQITFVYIPTIAASVYNLWYTWYGRQVFWIDIEGLLMGLVLCCLHVRVILLTQNEYIRHIFDADLKDAADGKANGGQAAAGGGASGRKRRQKQYLVDQLSRDLANDIAKQGYRTQQHRRKIQVMSNEQRSGTLRAIFDRMFTAKLTKVDEEGYKLKHGRGTDINDKIYTERDLKGNQAYAAAGVAITSSDGAGGGYRSEMPKTKSKKMMYSSVGDEDRRRSNQIKEDRANQEYRQFNGNDVTETGGNINLETATPRSPKMQKKLLSGLSPVRPKGAKDR